MGFRFYAACHVVPLLARLVLAGAFILAGYGKVFQEMEVSDPEDVRLLRSMGVLEFEGEEVAIRPVEWRGQDPDEGPIDPQDEGLDEAEGEDEAIGEDPPVELDPEEGAIEEEQDQAVPGTLPTTDVTNGGPAYRVKKVNGVALTLAKRGWTEYAVGLAWLAALTEFVGGILLLIGLLSRVWGLGLAITMATAFYLASVPALTAPGVNLLDLPSPIFNMVFNQLALFVLAFGIFLTGPGILSLDRAIFRRPKDRVVVDEDDLS